MRDPDGGIDWGSETPHPEAVVDWVVVMHRFDQGAMFDALARNGELTPSLVVQLTDEIVRFHHAAEIRRDKGGSAAVAAIEAANIEGLRSLGGVFDPAKVATLHTNALAALGRLAALLDARRDAGKVRRCHGDLHLGNVCLLKDRPVLFDCLEFSEDLATIDVLYDFAFLLMDLAHRGLRDLANLAANPYFDLSDEEDGLAALPLFMSMRAAIRALVRATAARDHAAPDTSLDEARSYLDLALAALAPQPARLIAIGGLSGVGKSTITRGLAPELGTRPGGRVLRSDVIRKRLCGVMPETRLPAEAYSAEMTEIVYRTLRDKAAAALQAGYCTIIDAVSLRPEERASFRAVADEAGVAFTGLWLEAPAEALEERLQGRRGDASDATSEVMRQQMTYDPGPLDWVRIEVTGDIAANLARIREAIQLAGGSSQGIGGGASFEMPSRLLREDSSEPDSKLLVLSQTLRSPTRKRGSRGRPHGLPQPIGRPPFSH